MAHIESRIRAHAPKTLAESSACFALTATALGLCAVAIQWALHLLP